MGKVVKLYDDNLGHYLDHIKHENSIGNVKKLVVVYTTPDDECVIVKNSMDNFDLIQLKTHLELQIVMDMIGANLE